MAIFAVNKKPSSPDTGLHSGGFRAVIKRRVTDISEDEWNSVFPDVLDSYRFFKSIDESGFSQFSFHYILIYDDSGLAAIAPSFVMDYPLETSVSGPLRRFINFARKHIPRFLTVRIVFCGVPMGQGKIGISGDRQKAMVFILSALEKIAKESRSSIIAFKDFTADYASLLDSLLARDFVRIESLPSAEMEISFKSFGDYMAGLSRKTRQDLKRKFKKVDGVIDIQMETVNSLARDELERVYELYLGQIKKHEDTGFELIPREFFRNIAKNMPDETRFFLWKIKGKIIAFMFALASRDYLSAYYLGLDYGVAYDYHLYFVRFRDIMNWCIKNGIKKCDVGVTGYEPKKRLDFGFVPLYVYAKHRKRFLRPFFKAACRMLRFENFDPDLKSIRENSKK